MRWICRWHGICAPGLFCGLRVSDTGSRQGGGGEVRRQPAVFLFFCDITPVSECVIGSSHRKGAEDGQWQPKISTRDQTWAQAHAVYLEVHMRLLRYKPSLQEARAWMCGGKPAVYSQIALLYSNVELKAQVCVVCSVSDRQDTFKIMIRVLQPARLDFKKLHRGSENTWQPRGDTATLLSVSPNRPTETDIQKDWRRRWRRAGLPACQCRRVIQ